MSHTKGKCEVVHTNWRTSLLVFGGRIMAECNVDPDFDEDNASDVEAEDAEMEKTANAERIAALWNAAEELGLTTEAIEKGVIQMAFAHSHEQGWVIEVALARIKKLEAEKAEMGKVLLLVKIMIDSHAKHLTKGSGYRRLIEAIKNQGKAREEE